MGRIEKSFRRSERETNRSEGQECLSQLQSEGYLVARKSPAMFRVNDLLDIYPVNRRYFDLRRQERGDIPGSMIVFVRSFFA